KRWLTQPSAVTMHGDWEPALAPDGRTVAFVRGVGTSSSALYLLPLGADLRPAGEPRQIEAAGRARSPAWTADGRDILFPKLNFNMFAGSGLWRIAVNTAAPPRELRELGTNVSAPAVSRTGRLAFSRFATDENIWRQELPERAGAIPGPVNLIASTALD